MVAQHTRAPRREQPRKRSVAVDSRLIEGMMGERYRARVRVRKAQPFRQPRQARNPPFHPHRFFVCGRVRPQLDGLTSGGPNGRSVMLVALEGEHRDAGAVHAFDLHGDAVGLDGITGLGGPSEGAQDVAAYGVEVFVGEVEFEAVVHVRDGDAAVHGEEVGAYLLDGGFVFVELVLYLTHDLLDDILDGDETLDAPPLVDDYGHLQRAGLELLEDFLYTLVLGDDEAFPDNGPYVEIFRVLAGGSEEILYVGCAEDVIEVPFVDGVARVAAVHGGVGHLRERGVARYSLYVGPWHHDLARHPVAEVEDVVQVVALFGVEHARGGGGGDHDPQFLLGVGLHLLSEPDAPGPQHEVRGGVDHVYHGGEHHPEHVQRAADPERHHLGPLNGEVLGRLLPEDEVSVGYDRKSKHDGDEADHTLVRNSYGPEQRLDEVRDGRLADPTKREAGDRNTDLVYRKVGVEVTQRLAHDRGPRDTLLLQLHEPRLAHTHQRELGGDEESVQAHENKGHKEVKRG